MDAKVDADPAVAVELVVSPPGLHGAAVPPVALAGAVEFVAPGWADELAGCAAAPAAGGTLPAVPGAAAAVAGGHEGALAAGWVFFLPNSDPRFWRAAFAFWAAASTEVDDCWVLPLFAAVPALAVLEAALWAAQAVLVAPAVALEAAPVALGCD